MDTLSELLTQAPQYEGFIVDQFGVLHDGRHAYPGAAQALATLRAQGKRVLVLSNSGKRAADNQRRLAAFGFGADQIDGVLSSGELAHQQLAAAAVWPFAGARRLWVAEPEADAPLLAGLPHTLVAQPEDADLLLLASLREDLDLPALQARLTPAAQRGVPLVCANPDLQRLTARGLQPSCGAVAQAYAAALQATGGSADEAERRVLWLGKPHAPIYAACIAQLHAWGATRLLAVGDSLAHDVAGAAAAGLDSCLIAAGLPATAFGLPAHAADHPVDKAVDACRIHGGDKTVHSPEDKPLDKPASAPGLHPHWAALGADPARLHTTLRQLLAEPEAAHAPSPTWVLPRLAW
ncbi:TIGR01459 family HAD-type hydrolase [Ideonella livida]|uniref:TIGR01459 family HAD-type hydrolase n=1 Tax=Ideonella livida TaxID=2707176 RepID=A0A7C9PJY0_9BURK|nr:TIGR01459 family HAD-type hydrolase [Ideonella livida]NDY92930.1 TIGR01459 family HAD-type hydrolase [Ideonella livida]